ncbi:hypothetical protein ACKI1L_37630, partial [Streptomyces scabiei]|uniref:hypothetical protein n=1 Tax=Streptomyces scabiei TaxID=1930 RepID=UPI0038F61319
KDFLRLSRPLSISGLSHHSTGHTFYFARTDAIDDVPGRRDFGIIARDPRLPDLKTLQQFLANEMLVVQRQFFPEDPGIAVNFHGLAQAMA